MSRVLLGLARTALLVALVSAGTYTDDAGTVHTWVSPQPKVVAWTFDAVSLYHMGMHADQLVGTYGERSSSGSNHGGLYSDGNVADHGNHSNAIYDITLFPADPLPAERAFLVQAADLSPDCSHTNYWCAGFDITIFDTLGAEVVIEGPASSIEDTARYELVSRGIPIITLSSPYKVPDAKKSMIAVAQRFEKLAIALGVPNVLVHTLPQKMALCAAAESFKGAAKLAQEAGVRALAAYLPYTAAGAGGEVGGFVASPGSDPVLTMMEELGAPIMHNNDEMTTGSGASEYWEYQVTSDWSAGTMEANNIMSKGSDQSPAVRYPVDFWLYDDRVTLDVTSADFAASWPDEAIVQKQMAYWPSNAKIYSYDHAAEILVIVGDELGRAQRLHTDYPTSCTDVDGPLDGEEHMENGLKPGEYACYAPVELGICTEMAWQGPQGAQGVQGPSGLDDDDDKSAIVFAAFGVAVAALGVAGIALALALRKPKQQILGDGAAPPAVYGSSTTDQ